MTRRTIVVAIITAAAVAAVLSYRAWLQPPLPIAVRPAAALPSPEDAKRAIASRDSAVVAALWAGDVVTLSRHAHPSKGVRISHDIYVLPDSDVVFTGAALRQAALQSGEYLWGHADGTGDPIRMTLRAYLQKYYATDFSKAPRIAYNAPPLRVGNTPNNLAEVYPLALRVERHFPGFEERYGGMD
jgi:hypothetical protein